MGHPLLAQFSAEGLPPEQAEVGQRFEQLAAWLASSVEENGPGLERRAVSLSLRALWLAREAALGHSG